MEDWEGETGLFLEAILILFEDQRAQIFLTYTMECFRNVSDQLSLTI